MNQVRVEKAGNRILVGSSNRLGALDRAIPGAYFRKDGFWSVPLEFESCVMLREHYGKRLVIGPALADWARAEKAHRARMRETASSLGSELQLLPTLAPKLMIAMQDRLYQPPAVRFMVDAKGRDGRRRALLADTVGLGKTAEALGAFLESGVPGPYLIVCPKTAVNSTWRAEIRRWLPEDQIVTIPEGRTARENVLNSLLYGPEVFDGQNGPDFEQALARHEASLARTWVIVHPYAIRTQTWWICPECGSPTKFTTKPTDQLDCGHAKTFRTVTTKHEHVFPQLFRMEYGGIAVDESHQILIKKTGTPNLQRRGAELLGELVRPGGLRVAISGTPTRSKPHQLWSTLNWLDPVRWSGKWRWIGKYWDTANGTFGGMSIGEFREERQQMMAEELADVMLRRERSQVRADLPPRDYAGTPLYGDGPKGIWLEMTPKQAKAYNQMRDVASVTLNGGTLSPIGILAEMTRLKQFACSEGEIVNGEYRPLAAGNKWEWLVEFMQSLGFPDQPATKLVFASQFTSLLKVFGEGVAKEFGTARKPLPVGYVTGEESQRQRDAYIAAFEDPNSGLDVIFLNTLAGGSSITLDAADVMVIDDENWVDDDQEQLEGRIDNRNPERKIVPRTYYYLRSLGTLEESIAASNAEAKALGKTLMDSVKPAQLARRVVGSRS